MIIFIVGIVIGIISGIWYFSQYELVLESVVLGFLLFVVADTVLRAVFNKKFGFWNMRR